MASRIAAGATKGPFATIDGNFRQVGPDEAFEVARLAMGLIHHLYKLGFDPERHSYFYDRMTTQPVVSADPCCSGRSSCNGKKSLCLPLRVIFKYSTTQSSIEPFVSTPARVKEQCC